MLCALSGQLATSPVVSPKSGAVFEKKLIESYIATAGKDPISDQPLDASELVPLRTSPAAAEPKPPVYNSIPTMLQAFQNEWDALALETFSLRKSLQAARDDLSASLYKYDAAVRVIARVTRERDEAREALTSLSESVAAAAQKPDSEAAESTDQDTDKVDTDKVVTAKETLSRARETLFAFHKKTKFALAVSKESGAEFSDAEVVVDSPSDVYAFDAASAKIVVSGAAGTSVLSADSSADPQTFPESYRLLSFLQNEAFGVSGTDVRFVQSDASFGAPETTNLAAHPSAPLFVAAGTNSFSLCDRSGPIATVATESPISASDIHVDGTLFGVAHQNAIHIYDMTLQKKVSEIFVEEGHEVTQLRFAFNGYWLVAATASPAESAVVVLDLRKNSVVHRFAFAPGPTDFVLDPSCQALVTANGGELQVHLYAKKGKSWRQNVSQTSGHLSSMSLACTVDEYQTDSVLKVCGLQSGKLVQYQITFPA